MKREVKKPDLSGLTDDQMNKVMRRIKNETLDKAEMWWDLYQAILPNMLDIHVPLDAARKTADVCDKAIAEYEERWG